MLELIAQAIGLAANPFALAGYILLGVYSQTLWQAFKYGVMWGIAIFIFIIALGGAPLANFDALAVRFVLHLAGAVIITVAVFYLYRALRGRGGGRGAGPRRGNGARKPPPLKRVK